MGDNLRVRGGGAAKPIAASRVTKGNVALVSGIALSIIGMVASVYFLKGAHLGQGILGSLIPTVIAAGIKKHYDQLRKERERVDAPHVSSEDRTELIQKIEVAKKNHLRAAKLYFTIERNKDLAHGLKKNREQEASRLNQENSILQRELDSLFGVLPSTQEESEWTTRLLELGESIDEMQTALREQGESEDEDGNLQNKLRSAKLEKDVILTEITLRVPEEMLEQ